MIPSKQVIGWDFSKTSGFSTKVMDSGINETLFKFLKKFITWLFPSIGE